MHCVVQHFAISMLFVGYVPLPKTKLDFTELDAKPTKKVCYMCTVYIDMVYVCMCLNRRKMLLLMIGHCVVNVKLLDHPEHITVGQYLLYLMYTLCMLCVVRARVCVYVCVCTYVYAYEQVR